MDKEYYKILYMLEEDYPEVYKKARTEKQKRILASFYNLGVNSVSNLDSIILEEAMAISEELGAPRNLNDFYSILLYATKSKRGFSKKAYPQFPLVVSDDYDEEFDLDKWSKLVYKIYDAVLSTDMSLKNAIDYYANTLNTKAEEDVKFKKWLEYHIKGEGEKYASEEVTMKKQSDYQFGLNGSNFYYPDTIPVPEDNEVPLKQKLDNKVDDVKKKERINDWKNKLDGAIRRIDKLIRSLDDPAAIEELFNSLHNFNMTVQRTKNNITASDIAYRTANNFKKLGFDQGHEILVKTAQDMEGLGRLEAPDATPDESLEDIRDEAKPVEQLDAQPGASEDPVERLYENTSGAKEGEYEKLTGDVDLSDAISKLEEVAARLSDRRVIRLLAEFDIMLDKIGIAAMFPELAESQSKLIDSYSYALVRVTKMLGMLSSGKNLSEISEARKNEMTGNVRKEVDKTFNPPPAKEPRGEEAIKDEFSEEIPTETSKAQAPPSEEVLPE